MSRVIIVGGGLSGCLASLALARRRPDLDLLLIEESEGFGGKHTWSFFDSDVEPENAWVIDGLIARRWDDHEIRFPRRERRIGIGYNSIRSDDLDRLVRSALRPDQYRLKSGVAEVAADCARLVGGERIDADAVIDARGPQPTPGLDLGWQKFVGRTYRYASGHGCERPMIMDATVEQIDGFRFVYLLPFSETELLIEDTYYSNASELDVKAVGDRVEAYAGTLCSGPREQIDEETGVLPVLIAGELADLWPATAQVPRLGVAGGFFHPTTGYSLPDAVANAALLCQQPVMTSAALHRLFRQRAEQLWKDRRFFQLLDRMLFRAAEPGTRYRVLEHFYRLPETIIARFYAARLTSLDKLRILSGRPPVGIGDALSALRKEHA